MASTSATTSISSVTAWRITRTALRRASRPCRSRSRAHHRDSAPTARSENSSKQLAGTQPMPDMTDQKTIELRVLRYSPSRDSAPAFGSFRVPYADDTSVLQALQEIKATLDGSLAFRWSCRMAVCGSCGMMINGEPKLACNTFLRDLAPNPVTIEPLQNFPIERDLIVTVGGFVKKIESIYPYIIPKAERTIEQGTYLQTPAQM